MTGKKRRRGTKQRQINEDLVGMGWENRNTVYTDCSFWTFGVVKGINTEYYRESLSLTQYEGT